VKASAFRRWPSTTGL